MKVKYYLRGLGTGILLSTAILCLGGKNTTVTKTEELTDDEIISRAEELGMVMNSDSSIDYNSILDSISGDEEVNEEDGEDTTEDGSESDSDSSSSDSNDQSEDAKDGSTEKEDTSSQTSDQTDTEDADASEAELESADTSDLGSTTTGAEETGELVSVTISSGMGTKTVSSMLEEAGLVLDADDFTKYMSQQQLTTKLQTGTFYIPVGCDYYEISRIITQK